MKQSYSFEPINPPCVVNVSFGSYVRQKSYEEHHCDQNSGTPLRKDIGKITVDR